MLFIMFACGSRPLEIVAGGNNQVIVIDYETSDTCTLNIVWSWKADEATDLPEVYKDYLRSVDECKSVDNHKKILLTSSSGAAEGNSIELYDMDKPDVVLYKDSLYSGHGVVWIPETEQLFALGFSELREYSLVNWDTENPELQVENSWKIPGTSGHDLMSVSQNRLLLTR